MSRCVKPDETSATVRCHYLTDGTVNFAFTVRRQEFFIPVGLLFKCFMEISDKEMSEKLMACCAEVGSTVCMQCLTQQGRDARTACAVLTWTK